MYTDNLAEEVSQSMKFVQKEDPISVLPQRQVRPKKTRIQQLLSREAAAPLYHEMFSKLKPIVSVLSEPEPICFVKKLPIPKKILPPPPLIELKGPEPPKKKEEEEKVGSANQSTPKQLMDLNISKTRSMIPPQMNPAFVLNQGLDEDEQE